MPLSLAIGASLLVSATSFALPPGKEGTGLKPGANHHIGDDSFVAKFGRKPTDRDNEHVRMKTHLQFIHKQLAAKPAADPKLQKQRDKILGFLGDYAAKGTTPKNEHLPWRTPVFIDDDKTICAVGYLIEQSAGRALPEKIAATHRYELIEDIAKAMPEVSDWVASSGLTMEEIQSIQPGYVEPAVESWQSWPITAEYDDEGNRLPAKPVAAGPFSDEDNGRQTLGAFDKAGKMTGTWKVVSAGGKIIGLAEMTSGNGTWHSMYESGKPLATGPMHGNSPDGAWKFFHPSGNLAAEGAFAHGQRNGAWRFYYDTAAKTPIAIGTFAYGGVSGTWSHFDQDGAKLATSINVTPASWKFSSGGHLLSITPGADGVRHEVHQGNIGGDNWRLDGFYKGNERIYVDHNYEGDKIWDADGNALALVDGTWTSGSCHWSAKRKTIARNADITTLHGVLYSASNSERVPVCDAGVPVAPARAKTIGAMMASMHTVRAQSADFVRKLALGEETIEDAVKTGDATADADVSDGPDEAAVDNDDTTNASDLARVLASNMTWYVEWPHIDGRFEQVFKTIAGYKLRYQ